MTTEEMMKVAEDAHAEYQQSPLVWCEDMLGLTPQPLKPEYSLQMKVGKTLNWGLWQNFVEGINEDWFEPFEKGKHLTWQQYIILLCIEKALKGEANRKISVVAGRGIGKSNLMAIVILWFLYSFPDSILPCTAVTGDQLDEAMWKEVSNMHSKLPKEIREKYDITSDHVNMKESPDTWFARARTASKDRPEALSGVHSDWIMAIVDEASAIFEKVFEMGMGVLTSENAFLLMISNGTRTEGFFYRSHHENKANYQTLSFSSVGSPVVDPTYVQTVIDEYCQGVPKEKYNTVTEYRVNVSGLFPMKGVMDDKGYVPLLDEKDLNFEPIDDVELVGHRVMGVDCAGDGDDMSVWMIRDRVRAKYLGEESTSTSASIGSKTVTYAEKEKIDVSEFRDIIIDAFGVGHSVSQEIALITRGNGRTTPVNTGDQCELEADRELYMNQRAEAYWKLRQWVKAGGILPNHPGLKKDLLNIKYRRVGAKIQIEPKVDMKKRGVKSPDYSDSLSLTFLREVSAANNYMTKEQVNRIKRMEQDFDRHSVMGE